MTRLSWFLLLLASVAASSVAWAHKPLVKVKDYAKSDSDLIQYIYSDRRFAATSTCNRAQLTRSAGKNNQKFIFIARCGMNPPSNGECREFRVRASGSVDLTQTYTAHIDSVTLTTICHRG